MSTRKVRRGRPPIHDNMRTRSVNLPEEQWEYLEGMVGHEGIRSLSDAVRQLVRLNMGREAR